MSTKPKIRGPDSILKIDPASGFCVGQVKSESRRCTKPVNRQNLAAANALIDVMEEEKNLLDVKKHLQKLASLTLCREWHNSARPNRTSYNQIDETTRKWKKLVDEAEKLRVQKAEEKAEAEKSKKPHKTLTTSSYQDREPEIELFPEKDLRSSQNEMAVQRDEKEREETIDELLKRLEDTIEKMNESKKTTSHESENTENETDDMMELQSKEKARKEAIHLTPSESDRAYITPPISPRTIHVQTIMDQHPITYPVTPESESKVQCPRPDVVVKENPTTPPRKGSDQKGKIPIDKFPPSPSPAQKLSGRDATLHKTIEETVDEGTEREIIFPQVPQQINFVRLPRVAIAIEEQIPRRQITIPLEYDRRDPLQTGNFSSFFPHVPQNFLGNSSNNDKDNSQYDRNYNFSDIFGKLNSPSPVGNKEDLAIEKEKTQSDKNSPVSSEITDLELGSETAFTDIERGVEQQHDKAFSEHPKTPPKPTGSFGHAVITPPSIKYKAYLPTKQAHGLITPPETPEISRTNPLSEYNYNSSPDSSPYFTTPKRQPNHLDMTPTGISRKPLLQTTRAEEEIPATIESHIPAPLHVNNEMSGKGRVVTTEDRPASSTHVDLEEDNVSFPANCVRRFGFRRLKDSIKAKVVSLKIQKEVV